MRERLRSIRAKPETPVTSREHSPTKEGWIFSIDYLTISGSSGAGKTSTAKALSEMYGIEFISVGDIFRKIMGEVVGYKPRGKDLDRRLDEEQLRVLLNSSINGPVIVEGRMAGVIANELKHTQLDLHQVRPVGYAIIFTADKSVKFKRIADRENEERQRLHKSPLAIQEVKRLTKEREAGDVIAWSQLHPQLKIPGKENGIDPFSPNAKNGNGIKIYDFHVSTSSKRTIPENAEYIHQMLLGKKAVRKGDNVNFMSLPSQGAIFISP